MLAGGDRGAKDAVSDGADAAKPGAGAQELCGGKSFRPGAYELSPASGPAKVSLFASGSEVEIALAAQKTLEAEGIFARVVSVPCFELFQRLDDASQKQVIGEAPVRVAVEAGLAMGWDLFLGRDGEFVGMTGFGASAPYKKLYEHFGITADAVAQAARKGLNRL